MRRSVMDVIVINLQLLLFVNNTFFYEFLILYQTYSQGITKLSAGYFGEFF